MRIVKSIGLMRSLARAIKREGKAIGFIPTMGYLHEGHLSLIKRARKDTDIVVVSIYVNPMQFGPKEDFRRYPRDLKRDMKLASSCGADVIFMPSDTEMYPKGYSTFVNVEGLSEGLCGKSRPGHFKGVSTVVAKLFNIVTPDIAYFGQKDAQQATVIERMTRDLDIDIKIKVMPVIRESDGLAMSSRNIYLDSQERANALCLHKALELARSMICAGGRSVEEIILKMKKYIEKYRSSRIDYIEIVDARTLKPIEIIKGKILIALAVWIGKTRLIDNIVVSVKKPGTCN